MIGLLVLASGHFFTGNDLYATCSGSLSDRMDCIGYVTGVADEAGFMQDVGQRRFMCMPAGVSRGQIRDIAVAYLTAHPENRQQAASVIVTNALDAAFPCPKQGQ